MNPQSRYQNEIINKCINSKLEQEIWVILFNERKRERERELKEEVNQKQLSILNRKKKRSKRKRSKKKYND